MMSSPNLDHYIMLSPSQGSIPANNNRNSTRRTSNFFPSGTAEHTNNTTTPSLISTPNLVTPQEHFPYRTTSLDSSPFLKNSRYHEMEIMNPGGYNGQFTSMSESTTAAHSPVMLSTTNHTLGRSLTMDYKFSSQMTNLSISGPPQLPNNISGFAGSRSSFSAGSAISTGSVSSIGSSSIWNDSHHSSTTILGNSLLDELENDYLFSPFWKEEEAEQELEQQNQEEKLVMQQEKLQLKSNIYVNKVNNPTFIPSSGFLEENSKSAIKISDKAIKKSKAKKDASDVRQNYKIEAKFEEEEQSLSRKNIKIKLPNIFRNILESDYFLKDMISSQEANRYGEDYCSTFYKRNIHGYMFIKEPSNSLKVNTSGGKPSVSLKISLPAGNNRLLARKLKVDVKELPIWKPISSGSGGTASSTARRRGPNVNSNNISNGIKEMKSIQSTQDPPKLKNGNLSKRFGRRNTPKQTP